MKRILFSCVATVLLLSGTVSADLIVKEYIPGEKVTLDTETGHYWYWNLADFVNMTYDEQITAIDGLGKYGFVDGGWHMATLQEFDTFFNRTTAPELAVSFSPTRRGDMDSFDMLARVDFLYQPISWTHPYGGISGEPGHWDYYRPPTSSMLDALRDPSVGAWVTSNSSLVPVPPAVILAATGLLSSMLGLNRLHRKH